MAIQVSVSSLAGLTLTDNKVYWNGNAATASAANNTLIGTYNSTAKTFDTSAYTGTDGIKFISIPANWNITGTAGDDTFTPDNAAGIKVTVNGGAGNDTLNFTSTSQEASLTNVENIAGTGTGTVTADGSYTVGTGATVTGAANINATVEGAGTAKTGANGTVTVAAGKTLGTVDLANANSTAVINGTLTAYISDTGDNASIAFGKNSSLSAPNSLVNVLLKGANNTFTDASSLAKNIKIDGVNASVTAGSGNDIITATSTNAVIDGGAGNDNINLIPIATNATVVFGANSGNDTVAGFIGGLATGADVIDLGNTSMADLTYNSISHKVGIKDSYATLEFSAVLPNDNGVLVKDAAGTHGVAFVDNNTLNDSATYADTFIGDANNATTPLNVTTANGMNIDLAGSGIIGDNKTYYNINNVSVNGAGDAKVVGTTGSNKLTYAGTGSASLWGGAGDDTLQGKAGVVNKVDYFVGMGDDTVENFDTKNDKLTFINTNLAGITRTAVNGGNALTVNFDAGDAVQLTNMQNNGVADTTAAAVDNALTVQYGLGGDTLKAKVGVTGANNSFKLASDVNFYIGSASGKDTVTVDDGAIYGSTQDVWLSGTDALTGKSTGKYFGDIDALDGSAVTTNVILAGNDGSNTITAGKGNSSLWGGFAGNDTLIGNASGKTDFYYLGGTGSDTIEKSKAADKVMLSWNNGDTATATLSGDNLLINLPGANSTLTIAGFGAGNSVNTFEFADGTYSYNSTDKKLEKAQA